MQTEVVEANSFGLDVLQQLDLTFMTQIMPLKLISLKNLELG